MTNTKGLRAEVDDFVFSQATGPDIGIARARRLGAFAGATSPDSPLLKRAIELLDVAIEIIRNENLYSLGLESGLKEIRECQESLGK